ncbi:13591_t:CDS:2, partial [Gigaspora rosea]
LVSKFDTIPLQWSEPTTSGSIPTSSFGRDEIVQCLRWSTFTSSLMYSGTQFYSATLLNDSILYIGGASGTIGPFFRYLILDLSKRFKI